MLTLSTCSKECFEKYSEYSLRLWQQEQGLNMTPYRTFWSYSLVSIVLDNKAQSFCSWCGKVARKKSLQPRKTNSKFTAVGKLGLALVFLAEK